MKYKIGDEIKFYYEGTLCSGVIVKADRDVYTVNFEYREPGKAPVNVTYDLTEIEIIG